MSFIKTSELKLTQVELFSLLHFKSVGVIISELFCVALQANNENFLYHYTLAF